MTVFTLGYEKRNIQEYIQILKMANVKVLVDVRETAWSYKRDFCKVRFSTELQNSGIHYIHFKDLGNPKTLRKADLSHNEILQNYRNYLKDTKAGLPSLLELLTEAFKREISVCLTCFERNHKSCHRSIITEHLPEFEVTHL